VQAIDADRNRVQLTGGDELPFDLFLGVPRHRAPAVVIDAGLTVDGWIPVDPLTLETTTPGVYAIGDVTSVGTPKAGVFAEGQAKVVAARISEQLRTGRSDTTYEGRGICYLDFGDDTVAKVDVTFRSGAAPHGRLLGPSPEFVADKVEFGTSRVARWFGSRARA
jgi:sulfide:quinone oxidoreductase